MKPKRRWCDILLVVESFSRFRILGRIVEVTRAPQLLKMVIVVA